MAFVEGSINSANATEFGAALAALPGEAESVTLDIAGLDYISSAGLRVLLSLKKRCGKKPFRADHTKLDEYVKMYADTCKRVHTIHTSDPEIPPFKKENRVDIANVTGITDEERQYLHRFLDLVPEADTCIHGDLNINNIMVQGGECCLIDMGELSTGTPMFDISRILFSMIYAAPEHDDENE